MCVCGVRERQRKNNCRERKIVYKISKENVNNQFERDILRERGQETERQRKRHTDGQADRRPID